MALGVNVSQELNKHKNNVTEYTTCSSNKHKNPDKYRGHFVIFTATNSENCDIRGSKGKAF